MLDTLDLDLSLEKEPYQAEMERLMSQLRSLQKACWQEQLPVVVLEGWAASGKGALVKKMITYMDPRGFQVHPIWPPSKAERQFPMLWRFWQKLPSIGAIAFFYHSWYTHVLEDRLFERVKNGQIPTVMAQINAFERQLVDDGVAIAKFCGTGMIGIFNRSWYGRMLVEQVERFATELEWRWAYREINEFEAQLTTAGYVLVKFWLHISPEEQMKRFSDRHPHPRIRYSRNRDRPTHPFKCRWLGREQFLLEPKAAWVCG